MNKNGFFAKLILIVLILLIIGLFWFNGDASEKGKICETDDDCVKVRVGCCACNMGGEEKCVLKSEEVGYLEKLDNCSVNTFCAAFDNCKIKSCICTDGVCVT